MGGGKEYEQLAEKYIRDFGTVLAAVTSQDIARSYAANVFPEGSQNICIRCEKDLTKDYGNYPWIIDTNLHPWKIKCPSCNTLFPTNDFEAYYSSGLNKDGVFSKELADPNLLLNNSEDDEIKALGEKWGIDDGNGFFDENTGVKHTWIAYYNHFGNWYSWQEHTALVFEALEQLKYAYIYSGDGIYSDYGIALLYKISLVYPELEISEYSVEKGFLNNASYGQGKAVGSIWECQIRELLIETYDLFIDTFDYKKTALIIEEYMGKAPKRLKQIIKESLIETVLDDVKTTKLYGNFPMHQKVLIKAARCLNKIEAIPILEYAFRNGKVIENKGKKELTGGGIWETFYEKINADGIPDENSPLYNAYTVSGLIEIASLLGNEYEKYSLIEKEKLILIAEAHVNLLLNNGELIQIGDSGFTGKSPLRVELKDYIELFEWTQNETIGQLIYFMNGKSFDGLYYDMMHINPEKLTDEIKNIIEMYGEYCFKSIQMSDFGLNMLRSNVGDLWVYYGKNNKHGHADKLNFGFNFNGVDYSPDLGYPTRTDENARRIAWESNTISHNTVVIDKRLQENKESIGDILCFDDNANIQIMQIDAADTYEETEQYKRTIVNIKVDTNTDYIFDLFQVVGGREHIYSFHGFNDSADVKNAQIENKNGTLSGMDIGCGSSVSEDEVKWNFKGIGLQYLKNHRVVIPDSDPRVIWKETDKFLEMRIVGDYDRILLADGEKPQLPENQGDLTYCLVENNNQKSKFTSLYFTDKNIADSIEEVLDISDEQKNVIGYEIVFKEGRRDYILFSEDELQKRVGDIVFSGDFVFISDTKDKTIIYTNGAKAEYKGNIVSSEMYIGKIVDFDKTDTIAPWIEVIFENESFTDMNFLSQKWLYFLDYRGNRQALEIERVKKIDDRFFLQIKNKSFIDKESNGINIYLLESNTPFEIPIPHSVIFNHY